MLTTSWDRPPFQFCKLTKPKTRSSHTYQERVWWADISHEIRADISPGLNNLLGSDHEVVQPRGLAIPQYFSNSNKGL